MTEMKIAQTILRERKKRSLTQEELASALNVSAQAVSNWERGGYPDITLLPRISGFFGISTDELLGCDAVSREADLEEYESRMKTASRAEQLALSKEYYSRYPSDFTVMENLAMAIERNKSCWESDYPLLKEVCTKILEDCTWEHTRQNAIECMSIVCPDEEWEHWQYKSDQFYSSCQNERIEERKWQRGEADEFYKQNTANTLLCLMHFLGREGMRYYEPDNEMLFDDPERTAALMKYRLSILEQIPSANTDAPAIPEAWTGCYAECCLKAAGASIAAGSIDEGFELLDRAFLMYERWLAIPDGALMDTGAPELFGGAKITKNDSKNVDYICFPDGSTVWIPYLWLFWQLKDDILNALDTWEWFCPVRESSRFEEARRRAEKLAQ